MSGASIVNICFSVINIYLFFASQHCVVVSILFYVIIPVVVSSYFNNKRTRFIPTF